MKCQKCNSENDGSSKFCRTCGTKLSHPTKSNKTWLWICAFAVLVVFAICIYSSNNSSNYYEYNPSIESGSYNQLSDYEEESFIEPDNEVIETNSQNSNNTSNTIPCPVCGGTGKHPHPHDLCNGSGRLFDGSPCSCNNGIWEDCENCLGFGFVVR